MVPEWMLLGSLPFSFTFLLPPGTGDSCPLLLVSSEGIPAFWCCWSVSKKVTVTISRSQKSELGEWQHPSSWLNSIPKHTGRMLRQSQDTFGTSPVLPESNYGSELRTGDAPSPHSRMSYSESLIVGGFSSGFAKRSYNLLLYHSAWREWWKEYLGRYMDRLPGLLTSWSKRAKGS